MDIQSYISSGVIEQYALGVLPKEEAAILECVMKNNAEVAAAVLEAQTVLEEFSELQAVQPPSHLKSDIFAKLNFEKPIENTVAEPEVSTDKPVIALEPKTEPQKDYRWLFAAASFALLIGLGWSLFSNNSKSDEINSLAKNNTQLESELERIQQENSLILNAKIIDLKGVETHPDLLASVYWDDSRNVYLHLKNLPKAPAGKQYQLWAIVDGKPVDAGVYDGSSADKIQKMKSIENAQAFAITLEKEGGSPTPTMEEMYVIGEI